MSGAILLTVVASLRALLQNAPKVGGAKQARLSEPEQF
jgi:hypothetical protein